MRVVAGLPSLRQRRFVEIIRTSIARAHRDDFRVAEFVIESNHLHTVCEAGNREAHARGLKGLQVSIAKRINRELGRKGALFADRYHTRALKTPREVRNALRYVLNNTRRHDPMGTELLGSDWIDPYSSAPWFKGWARPVEPDTHWKRALLERPPPTAPPRSWLLSVGWRRHGALQFDEVPGPAARR